MTLRVDFWALDDNGTILCPLPHPTAWDLSLIPGESGAVRLEYPVAGLNYTVLRDRVTRYRDLRIHIRTDGTLLNALGAVLKARDGDDLAEGGTVTFVGAFMTDYLDGLRLVYNTSDPKGETTFTSANAGGMMAFALNAANTAGDIPAGMTWSFNSTVDSRGTAWPASTYTSVKFSPGKTLLELAQQLRDWGMCEFEVTTALEVRLYVPGSVGIDRTTTSPPLILRAGRDLLEAPRRTDVGDAITDLIVAGADGIYVRVFSATARARRGRRVVGFLSEGSLKDSGSATAYAQNALSLLINGVDELTHTLTFDPTLPLPLQDFYPYDFVYSDTGQGITADSRSRIVQLTVSQQAGKDTYSGGVVLNDLIADRAVSLQRQIDRLKNGSTIVGTSTPPGTNDGVAPAAPTGIVLNSIAYKDGIDTYATVLASWSAVTLNSNGTACTDLAGYRVRWRPAAGPSTAWAAGGNEVTGGTSTSFGGVSAGVEIRVQVAAFDNDNNTSAWSAEAAVVTNNDTTAPPIPSTPVVTNYLGVLLVAWNGLGSAGEAMGADFDYVEIHMSTSASFTATSVTYIDRMYGKGEFPVADLTYGTTYYFRLIAVDNVTPTPNKSGQSGVGSDIPTQVVSQDVFDGAIGSAKLADLAVTTAKINDLAVNDAKIGNLAVGKLTAGTFSASLTLSGIFRTGTTGARGEWDSTSFRFYNAAGTQTIGLVPGGVSFITGEVRTALTGQRIVLNPGGSLPDTIQIFPSGAGNSARIMARTAPADGSAAILIDGGAATNTPHGRLGAYKGEAFLSFVADDNFGDGAGGYSRCAVSCASTVVNSWVQDKFVFSKYSGSSFINGSSLWISWGNGSSTIDPMVSATNQDAGIKFDNGLVIVGNAIGTLFGPIKATAFIVSSTAEAKTDIVDIRSVMAPLEKIRGARARAYRTYDEIATQGDAAPLRFGPLAEELPPALVRMTAKADGSGPELSVNLADQIGTLWGAVGVILDQSLINTTATVTPPALPAANTDVDVTVAWDDGPTQTVPAIVSIVPWGPGPVQQRSMRARVVAKDRNGVTVRFRSKRALTGVLQLDTEDRYIINAIYEYTPPVPA